VLDGKLKVLASGLLTSPFLVGPCSASRTAARAMP